jgi:phosphonatase-like hydrolase
MVKMVVFDMAGTTVNEENAVYNTIRKAINEEGYDFTLEEVLSVGAGKEKLQAVNSVLALKGIYDTALAEKIFNNFKVQLDQVYKTMQITEQPNASLLFRCLQDLGIYVVLNTGYSREVAESLLIKLGWEIGQHIDLLVTASDVTRNRPFPDMIVYAMQKLDLTDASQVIKVGDSTIDIEEGRNAGCLVNVGITTGAQTRTYLEAAQPTAIIDDLMELLPVIEQQAA